MGILAWPFGLFKSAINLPEIVFFTLALAPGNRTSVNVGPWKRLQQQRHLQNHNLRSSRGSASRCCLWPIRLIHNIVLYGYSYLCCSLSLRKSKEEKRREEAAAAEELAEPLPEVSKEKFFQVDTGISDLFGSKETNTFSFGFGGGPANQKNNDGELSPFILRCWKGWIFCK